MLRTPRFLVALGAAVAPLLVSAGGDPLAGVTGPANLVVTGFSFTEGPLWDPALRGLLFSELDTPLNGCGGRTWLLTEPSTVTVVRDPSCNANGLACDIDGTLLAAEHGSRSITRLGAGGTVTVVSNYQGMQLNAPNDLTVRADGTIYFTDPDFVAPQPPLLGFSGLYRLDTTGALVLEATMHSPNGIALAPDEQTLYVANQGLDEIVSFDVLPDGSLANSSVFATGATRADGMAIDVDGNLFVAVEAGSAGAILVFAPDGTSWGSIAVAEPAKNCAFGGADRKTLYITATSSIYSVQLTIPGSTCPRELRNRGGGASSRTFSGQKNL